MPGERVQNRHRVRDVREEKGAFDRLEAHNDAVAAEYERKRRGDADWRTMPPEDARNFGNAQRRLHVTHTAPPSDVLWENMHWSRATMWRRRLGTAIAMLAFIILETALISRSKVAVRNVLNPEPDCGSIGAGGATLDCPAIWDLDASTRANNRARRDIMHFVREDVSASDCADFVVNGAFLRDMSDYSGFADGPSVAYPSADAVAAFRDAQDRSSAYLGGSSPTRSRTSARHTCATRATARARATRRGETTRTAWARCAGSTGASGWRVTPSSSAPPSSPR